jgi:hypothetical protein
MFTVTVAIDNPVANSNGGFALAGAAGVPMATIDLGITSTTTAVTIVPPNPPVGGVLTVPAPVGTPSVVYIGGVSYTYAISSSPSVGTFTVVGGSIAIGYAGITPSAVTILTTPTLIFTDIVAPPFPSILSLFKLVGSIEWSMRLEEQPSARLEFIADAADRAGIIGYFQADNPIDIYGTGFSTSANLSITDIPLSEYGNNLIRVRVDLTGAHAAKLDKSVPTSIPTSLSCTSTSPPIVAQTVADIATSAGTAVIGATIPLDRQLQQRNTLVKLGSVLENRAMRTIGCYIDYNRVGGIYLLPWNGTAGINADRIVGSIDTDIRHLAGSIYFKIYEPTKVTYGSNSAAILPPITVSPPPPPPPPITILVEGDPNPSISPYGSVESDLSAVFDISGKRRRRKRIELQNGQPIREEEIEYGYVAVAKTNAIYDPISGAVTGYNGSWELISQKITNYTYNSDGYLISVIGSGFTKTRYKIENAQNPETLKINIGTPPDPVAVDDLSTYDFFNLPISTSETYQLVKFSDYYNDITPATITQLICLPTGAQITQIIPDPAWIPPYFVKQKIVLENSIVSRSNPRSTALKPLPNLTTGKSNEFIERVAIEPINPLALSPAQPTYYTKSTDNYSSSGAQFNAILSTAESQTIKGRPSVATRRDPISPTAPVAPIAPVTNTAFGIYSLSLGTGQTVGAIDYPNATTQAQAIAAAKTDIDIINTKNARVSSLAIPFRPYLYPGQTINYLVGSTARSGRILSVTQKLQIEGLVDGVPLVTSRQTSLTVGENMYTPVVNYILPV